MGRISYPKEFVKSDGRKLRSGGPRDLQRRQKITQSTESDITGLEKRFDSFKEELQKIQPQKLPKEFFSPEQVDEEVRKAVEQAIAEVSNNTNKNGDGLEEIIQLKKEIAVLKQNLVGKEELIETLKSKVVVSGAEIVDHERPKMEQQFIDPLEKDAGKGLKSHIDVTDTTESEKDNMSEKVNKLKNLLGKLPIGNN